MLFMKNKSVDVKTKIEMLQVLALSELRVTWIAVVA